MKKSTRKLVVRQETIRVLTSMDLVRAAGGDTLHTGEKVCTAQAVTPSDGIFDSDHINCTERAVVIATAA